MTDQGITLLTFPTVTLLRLRLHMSTSIHHMTLYTSLEHTIPVTCGVYGASQFNLGYAACMEYGGRTMAFLGLVAIVKSVRIDKYHILFWRKCT